MKIGYIECYGIIYKIVNKINNKVYIGQTIRGFNERYCYKGNNDIERVYRHHLSNKIYKKTSYNNHILNSIEKYGFGAFEVNKIFDVAFSKEELDIKERLWILIYNSTNSRYGYNNRDGGSRGKATENMKIKASQSIIGYDIYKYKDYIVNEYNKGKSSNYIADTLNICSYTILKYLKLWGVEIRDASSSKLKFDITKYTDDIIEMYKKYKNISEIGRYYNVFYGTIKRILINNNIKIEDPNIVKLGININDYKNDIIYKYDAEKKTIKEIADYYNIDDVTLSRKFDKWNIEKRSISEAKLKFDITKYTDDILNKYIINNIPISTISKKYNVNDCVIRRLLLNNDIKIKSNSEISIGFDINKEKENIIKLYKIDKYSLSKISDIYNNKISKSALGKYFKQWNVKTRNNSECKIGCCVGESNYNSKKIILYDIENDSTKNFNSISDCAKWMVDNNISNKINTAKDAINTSINKNRPYKSKYNFIKS